MRLILVRHTSVAVERGVCYGQTDVGLNDTFPREAAAVKEALTSCAADEVYCSPLSRCMALADFCGYGDAVIDSRLIEMSFGEWEMQRFDEITDPRLQEWYADYINVAATGGESVIMQRNRFLDFVSSVNNGSDKTVLLFTHGGILMQALVCFRGMSYDEALALKLPYGAIIEAEV